MKVYKAIFYLDNQWAGTCSTTGSFKDLWKKSHYELNEYRNTKHHAIMVYVRSDNDDTPFISSGDYVICVASPERIMTKEKCLLIK